MHDLQTIGFREGQAASQPRIARLETLIQKYAAHVANQYGLTLLGDAYRGSHFTDDEWAELRRIVQEKQADIRRITGKTE